MSCWKGVRAFSKAITQLFWPHECMSVTSDVLINSKRFTKLPFTCQNTSGMHSLLSMESLAKNACWDSDFCHVPFHRFQKQKQKPVSKTQSVSGWWFQIFFIFTHIWGRFPFWLIFFRWVGSTTNQVLLKFHFFCPAAIWGMSMGGSLSACHLEWGEAAAERRSCGSMATWETVETMGWNPRTFWRSLIESGSDMRIWHMIQIFMASNYKIAPSLVGNQRSQGQEKGTFCGVEAKSSLLSNYLCQYVMKVDLVQQSPCVCHSLFMILGVLPPYSFVHWR